MRFTSDPKKIAENRKIPIIYIDSKDFRKETGCKGYWQNPEDRQSYSSIEDEQGL